MEQACGPWKGNKAQKGGAVPRGPGARRGHAPSRTRPGRSCEEHSGTAFRWRCCAHGTTVPRCSSARAAAREEAEGRPGSWLGRSSATRPGPRHEHPHPFATLRGRPVAFPKEHAARSPAPLGRSPFQDVSASRETPRRRKRGAARRSGSRQHPMLTLAGSLRDPTRRAICGKILPQRGSQRQHSAQQGKSCAPRTDSGASDPPSINFPTYSRWSWLPGRQPLAYTPVRRR